MEYYFIKCTNSKDVAFKLTFSQEPLTVDDAKTVSKLNEFAGFERYEVYHRSNGVDEYLDVYEAKKAVSNE